MDIHEQRHGAVTVLKPVGPLCLGDADQFRTLAGEVVSRSLGRLVLDASAIAYVDSQGLEALLAVSSSLGEGGQVLRIASANETLREVFELTGLHPRFEHYDDLNAAVRSFL